MRWNGSSFRLAATRKGSAHCHQTRAPNNRVAAHEANVTIADMTRENALKLTFGDEHLNPDGSFTLTVPSPPTQDLGHRPGDCVDSQVNRRPGARKTPHLRGLGLRHVGTVGDFRALPEGHARPEGRVSAGGVYRNDSGGGGEGGGGGKYPFS